MIFHVTESMGYHRQSLRRVVAWRKARTDSLPNKMYDVLIIGAGPAGLSAARWCDELGLDTLLLEANETVGGQLALIHNRIGNYLGVQAVNGEQLRERFVAEVNDCDF